jgi:molybdate transport system substrate-binding protein
MRSTPVRRISMKIRSLIATMAIGAALLLPDSAIAESTEIKILAASAMRGPINELSSDFERSVGRKVVVKYDAVGVLKRQVEAGEAFDVVVLTPSLIDDLVKSGKVAANTPTDVARSALGVAIQAGRSKPDISSPEAFKRALLAAKSITYAQEGTLAGYLERVFERLGIGEEMKAKNKPQLVGGQVAEAVARGEAELGFTTLSLILSVPGAELLGAFPPELQRYSVFTAGVSAGAKTPEIGKAWIRFLTAPAAVPVLKAKGMEPVSP